MKRFSLLLLFCIPLILFSQTDTSKGIKWTTGLNWGQIKEKAKSEQKYIFVDCYATWCGPCKKMDSEVYVDDSVADFFNAKFLSVKVQMDQTEMDNEKVKSWYKQAAYLQFQFRINKFPSYIFLSPDGRVVHRSTGFQRVEEFIATARTALAPGMKDPYAKYDQLEKLYKQGSTLPFGDLPYMVNTATTIGDTIFRRQLMREYKSRMRTIPQVELYTKENIEFMASVIGSSKSEFFPLFYHDARQVNKVMQKKNYSQSVVDQIILFEISLPFLGLSEDDLSKVGNISAKSEPRWAQLYDTLLNRYNRQFARRGLLEAKIVWSEKQQENAKWIKYSIDKIKLNGVDTGWKSCYYLNRVAWSIFLYSTNRKQLRNALNWMQMVVQKKEVFAARLMPSYFDTYAGLLYKSGKRQKAIRWEERAIDKAIEVQRESHMIDFKNTLNRMKNNEQIWINR